MDNDELCLYIRDLLAPFIDAATTLDIKLNPPVSIRAKGQRRFTPFEIELDWEAAHRSELVVLRKRRRETVREPLATYLASSRFADLDAVARSMLDFLKSRLPEPSRIVESQVREIAERSALSTGKPQPATAKLRSSLTERTGVGTSLTYLRGGAGAGKSYMLMKAAMEQAQQFLSRQSRRLILYVDAQGVNLRSIVQQIARQLDLYNGILRYGEVTPLVRLGVMGVIIDGFDELITPSGYDDTVRALSAYMDQYLGEGALLASARTAFFDTYALEKAHIHARQPFHVRQLALEPWATVQRRTFCEVNGRPELAEVVETIADSSAQNEELLGRPFFVAEAFSAVKENREIAEARVLVWIEDAFAERERCQKLYVPERDEPILTRQQFDQLLSEIALEMWRLRQNSLDLETAHTVAELVSETWPGISQEMRQTLYARISSHALLETEATAVGEVRLRFPHEVFFARIVARAVIKAITKRDVEAVRELLSVAPLSSVHCEQFMELADGEVGSPGDVMHAIQVVAEKVPWFADSDSNVRVNLGGLTVALLKVGGQAGKRPSVLRRLVFSSQEFNRARLGGATFRQCGFQDVDARGAEWQGVEFDDCGEIDRLRIADGQKFPVSLPPVHWLVVERADGRVDDIYGSRPVRDRLFPEEGVVVRKPARRSGRAKKVARLLERLAKRAARVYWFSVGEEDVDDGFWKSLKQNAEWGQVIQLLDSHGLLEWDRRPRRGPQAELVHLRQARELAEAVRGDDRSGGIGRLLDELDAL